MRSSKSNWAQYNEALRKRDDISLWMSEDAINGWQGSKKTIQALVDQRLILI
jgi:hypothetical protein